MIQNEKTYNKDILEMINEYNKTKELDSEIGKKAVKILDKLIGEIDAAINASIDCPDNHIKAVMNLSFALMGAMLSYTTDRYMKEELQRILEELEN